jgi:dihydrofolate reductase
MPGEVPPFMISKASAALLDEAQQATGAMVAGRRMFDNSDAWQGRPPGDWPCFIVTHHPPQEWVKDGSPFTFVTDGVESAIRQARTVAGDKIVAVASASIAQQCLNAGLLDEIHLDLTPVILGGGVRLFDHLTRAPIDLQGIQVTEGTGVTHLAFRVIK